MPNRILVDRQDAANKATKPRVYFRDPLTRVILGYRTLQSEVNGRDLRTIPIILHLIASKYAVTENPYTSLAQEYKALALPCGAHREPISCPPR